MNPGLLDRLNENGAITHIAACGGLVATGQFAAFLDCHARTAQRAYADLARCKMARIIRAQRRAAFVVLTGRTVSALGQSLPRPPNPKTLRLINYQLSLARAEYFLQHEKRLHPTSDLLRSRSTQQRTLARIRVIVDAQQAQLKQRAAQILRQLKAAPTEALREQARRIRRHLRDTDAIMAAGAQVLRHRWGLFLVDDAGVRPRFVFVDRATPVRLYATVTEMLSKFSAATSLRTSLDVVCGSALSRERIEQSLSQGDLRLGTRILNLDYDRYLRTSAGLPALVGGDRIASMLASPASTATEDGACDP